MHPAPRENPHLLGHATAEAAILEALRGGRLHHAWLITGPEGVGKATLAYRFARRLLAGGGAALDMAASEPVFRRVAAGTHADLLTIEREWDDKKKRLKKQIAAETARLIPPFLHLTPAEGGWRVVILDGAEDLNPQSANALLKVLEEPPARAVLMLVCSAPGRLLPTIRSRCRHLALAPLGEAPMRRVLEMYLPAVQDADRAVLAGLSDGSPGRALALADDGGLRIAGMVEEVLALGAGMPLLRGYEMADALRDQAAFETFMGRRARGLAGHAARQAGQGGSGLRLAEASSGVRLLLEETERVNMDRRQAVIASLALVRQ